MAQTILVKTTSGISFVPQAGVSDAPNKNNKYRHLFTRYHTTKITLYFIFNKLGTKQEKQISINFVSDKSRLVLLFTKIKYNSNISQLLLHSVLTAITILFVHQFLGDYTAIKTINDNNTVTQDWFHMKP